MCGISGVFDSGPDREELVCRMISALQYRGPDETGLYLDDDVALGHCRLSIVGLDDGIQPIGNETGTLWIVYNGEVFNYPELREELQKKGHLFRTGTDTEVLIHLYEEYGVEGLAKVNGQFAFAIWDRGKKELLIARDRVGIRPLFYHRRGDRVLFASEMKALFADPSVPREIDPVALHQIFTLWTTVSPATVFRGVYELPPGHYQIIRKGKAEAPRPFWAIPYATPENRFRGSFAEAMEELKALLHDAIRIRLRADVPVGAYLSGGLDSSIITAVIARNFNNRLRTFSLRFQEEAFDETPYQREMAAHLGTDHRELLISSATIRDNFPQVIWHCETPLLRTAPVPMYLLSGLVRGNNFKVVLTGEGADEVFGGYDIFKEGKIRRFWCRRPDSKMRPRLLEKLHPYIFRDARSRAMLQSFYAVSPEELADPFFSHRVRWKNTGKNHTFFSQDVMERAAGYDLEGALLQQLPEGFSRRDPLAQAQFLEMTLFLSNYLLSSQGDRVAMGNSLELRVPFLDYRVIDFAMRLPPAWKIRALDEKHILKRAFRDLVPQRILSRPKHPYRAPIRDVFFAQRPGYLDELLSEPALKRSGYFDPGKVRMLVEKFRNAEKFVASETQNMALVGILSTQLVHEKFIDHFPSGEIEPAAMKKRVILGA
ncbi:asparagine synthase (glutamine-hydrolyzing) [Geomonas sp. RF6]|uniref:asparagine synthase (glutamine-hydrolyzing) n=1 Tax=Geomonas sp. RF6 TaxID=2897342 RepID=UPI001E588F51|nr:asparagine synthase (glutamine-hydrolyzing) [Geomonas sp. RF6]UFS69147.1 asparagine synthase (glutamine-hydrolyzing) [Geomonas sp. RF6]